MVAQTLRAELVHEAMLKQQIRDSRIDHGCHGSITAVNQTPYLCCSCLESFGAWLWHCQWTTLSFFTFGESLRHDISLDMSTCTPVQLLFAPWKFFTNNLHSTLCDFTTNLKVAMQRAKISDCVYMTLILCEGLLLVMRAGWFKRPRLKAATVLFFF